MKVLHILSSHGMGWTGGIRATLASLAQTRLASWVEFQLVTQDQAKATLKTWQPDLLVIHRASSWKGIPELLTLKAKARILVEHHYSAGFEQHQVPSSWRFRAMLRLNYRLMDRVVSISQGQQQWMQSDRLVASEKVRLICSSRNLDPFFQVPAKAEPEGLFTLAAYGRFTHQKGFDRLIEAVQLLPIGSVQLLLGGQGPNEQNLKALAQNHPHIHFLGKIDDVPEFLSRCDAVVIPSRWEPWGNVCLEARAAARPVLVSDIDGLTEQAKNCGIEFKPDSCQNLTDGIWQMINASPEQRQSWGQQGRLSAIHAWDDYVNAWEQVLREFK
ncbi:glycosyltransferase family 4 protein [Nostoc sp. UCD121]|uniref:glycosyltransferase family 4 protein n=1 Tax=unclassified Nostoc TaxID=2593658 RepID=UPI0016232FAC|nr:MULTISPECIES: glycosyltransferase family 4 protein [unclassified Nostoc]MBC1220728.1 glycosyltransferase family 4 protein [Nostoc sp. UCD120]MBC1280934.1 glycosyltransferase family 4 protein [Nostoc sp. UCD121]MBC1299088.1 glycosyltransferase family 4 protein [Nostoc sp. UCD122]